jgi:hypothetical protein
MAEDHLEKLEPPPRTSIDDPGAHDLGELLPFHERFTVLKQELQESSDSDEHFSDAHSAPISAGPISPTIPHTRVEKVDDEPSYGEEPGTEAYRLREQDASPDEIEIIHERKGSDNSHSLSPSPSPNHTSPGGQPIPLTVVEKVDPEEASYGEVPGTEAHEKRLADAVPDLVIRSGSRSRSSTTRSRAGSTPGDLPIPITKVEKIDAKPSHGEIPGTKAYELRKGDAEPDIVEEVGDFTGKDISTIRTSERLTESGSPTASRTSNISHARRKSSEIGKNGISVALDYDEEEDGSDGDFGDDFDDFEEGEEDAEFGDL